MAKKLKVGGETSPKKIDNTGGADLLDSLLGGKTSKEETPQPPKEETPQPPKEETPEPPKEEAPEPPKEEAPEPPKEEAPEQKPPKVKKEPEPKPEPPKVDEEPKQGVVRNVKKKAVDKKKPFSSILKESLQGELKEILKEYRQKIDFEYNVSNFVEDAVIAQLGKLKKQLKKSE